jgi:hypothetical protein
MTKLSANDFRNLLSSVRDSIASLASCWSNEIPNERRLLENVMAELRDASPKRRDDSLIERKVNLLASAQVALDNRPLPGKREVLTFIEAPKPAPQKPLSMSDRVLMGDRYVSVEYLMST